MRPLPYLGLIGLVITLTLAACSPAPSAGTSPPGERQTAPPGVKRITTAIRSSPISLIDMKKQRGGTVRGIDGVEELAHAGLAYIRGDGTRGAQIAEVLPTVDNGLWKVFPDGRMETTWTIKRTAKWHDGAPLTVDDFLFAGVIERDRELELTPYQEYDLIESIATPDPYTMIVTWRRPYIDADGMFSYRAAGLPLPKHLLEQAYQEDKANFTALPYWTEEFVGLGAFSVREWVRDSHIVLRAFDDYVFGRPKIDEIEVKFIPDNNTLLANIIAGTDLTLGKTLSLDIALGAAEQWKGGRIAVLPQNWTPINVQFIDPDPPIVADLRFRKALLLALDRQQLADFVFSGHGSVAHSYVDRTTPMYGIVEPFVVRYDYDPRGAAQILESLGYSKRGDGFLYDPAGRRLNIDLRIPLQNDIHAKTAAPVADYWHQLGVAVEQVGIPIQRATDREYRALYPAFEIVERRNSLQVSEMIRMHGSEVQLAEQRFRGSGTMRYRNAEHDTLIERYATTIPMPDRMEALGRLVHHQTENLTHLPIFFGADPTLISNRLINVTARGDAFTQAWNVHEWDVQ